MKHNQYHSLLSLLGLIVAVFFFLEAPICRADLMFDVKLDTSGLIGHPAGPFYIDFQLNDGSGNFVEGINTATISKFGGGSPSGTPHLFGGATGSLAAGDQVKLTDNAHFINEFFQQFTPGSSLSFTVSLTTNVDPGLTPDAFSFLILDSLLSPIPTTNFANAFLLVNINSANLSKADVRTFAGDSTRPPLAGGDVTSIGAPQIPGVPETGSSISMLLIGLGAVWCFRRRFLQLILNSTSDLFPSVPITRHRIGKWNRFCRAQDRQKFRGLLKSAARKG